MKKRILIIIAIGIIAAFLIVIFAFNSKLEELNRKIAALNSEISLLEISYAEKQKDIEDHLIRISGQWDQQEQKEQEKAAALKSNFSTLQKRVDQLHSDLNRQYEALNKKQTLNESMPAIQLKATPVPQPEKTKAPVIDDARKNADFISGKQALEKKDYAKAKQVFSRLLETDPDFYEAYLYYIQAAYYENPANAAADRTVSSLLDALPAGDKDHGLVLKFKGLLALERGAYNEAVAFLEQYRSYTKEADSLLALGECLRALKKQQEAGIVFLEIRTSFPGSAEAARAALYLKK